MALERQMSLEDMGRRLTARRAELGLTIEEVHKRVGHGIGQRTVTRWLRGEAFPHDRNLYHLARALEMDPSELAVEPPTPEMEARQLDRIEEKLDDVLAILARQQVRAATKKARAAANSRPARKRRKASSR